MQNSNEMRLIETPQGFDLQHDVLVPSSPDQSLRVRCSHNFQDKTLLETIKTKGSLPAKAEIGGFEFSREAHDLAIGEADQHEYGYSGSTIFTGTVHKLVVTKDSIKFSYEFWDDGNEYRDIPPSGYRETWNLPSNYVNEFLNQLDIKGIRDLLARLEGPEHLAIREHLKTFANQNKLYTYLET